MQKCIYLLLLTLLSLPLSAQRVDLSTIDSFQLSDYRARYDRRPLMEFDVDLSLQHFSNPFMGNGSNTFRGNFTYDWQVRRLQDQFIDQWNLVALPSIIWSDAAADNWRIPLDLRYTRQQFYEPRRFYGFEAGMGFFYDQTSGGGTSSATLAPPVSLVLFVGGGRIEFAEDALLAAWTLKDLEVAGVLRRQVSADDVHALARTITDLIGNRVFDLRRRRIYELEQLHAILQTRYPELPMSIELFTIMNDNWAFANRVILPHGNEWRIGPRVANTTNFNLVDGEQVSTQTTNNWGGFATWRRARIHRHRSGSELTIRLQGEKNNRVLTFNGQDFTVTDDFRSVLRGTYNYRWFPFSRTVLTAFTELGYNHWWDTKGTWTKSAAFWQGNLNLSADLFLSYQWNLNLGLGLSGNYFPENEEVALAPRVSIRSLYRIF